MDRFKVLLQPLVASRRADVEESGPVRDTKDSEKKPAH
jgi:hypothetical protein